MRLLLLCNGYVIVIIAVVVFIGYYHFTAYSIMKLIGALMNNDNTVPTYVAITKLICFYIIYIHNELLYVTQYHIERIFSRRLWQRK